MSSRDVRLVPGADNSTCPHCHLPILVLQKPYEQLAHLLRLFLLNPMSRTVDKMKSQHPRARADLHALDAARNLVDSPVALSRYEDRRHVDRSARKQFEFGVVSASRLAPIPLQSALEA